MNADESAVLISRLAVSNGLVTPEQLEECLQRRDRMRSKLPVAEMLLQLGYIDGEQYRTLMQKQSEERCAADEEGREEQQLFGRQVQERGLATPEQVSECLRVQSERAERGNHESLGRILVERGYLTESQVRGILHEDDKVIMFCSKCLENYNVLRPWQAKARCPQCGAELLAAEESRGVGVLATLEGGENADSPIGLEFGGCRILELLGRGAMGAVYKARHVGLNRLVAVKMLPMAGRGREIVKRLLFEARAVARLEHPNIVQVYDVGFQRGYFFLVLQLLNGGTLTKRIEEMGALFVDEAVRVASDVARGLETAHAAGIIHRDVKPDNIIVTEDGRARITDFGLAQDTRNPDEEEWLIVGTPYYMSPEQWLGHRADERSDLYSLGVIFYQMLTGLRPYEGERIQDVMHKHLKTAARPVHEHNPDVPETLSAIVRKMIAKSAAKRYPDMKELLLDLDRFRKGEVPEAATQFGRHVRCGFCETPNPVGERRCKVCGESLQSVELDLSLATRSDERKCPKCGDFVQKESHSCPRCGAGFCKQCRRRLPVLSGYCQYCYEHLSKEK